MNLNTYLQHHPAHNLIGQWDKSNKGVLRQGVIQFTAETACNWGGPFAGNVASYVLRDMRLAYPTFLYQPIAKSQEEAAKILTNCLAAKTRHADQHRAMLVQVEAGNADVIHQVTERGTAEHPFHIWIMGNDDTSYSKWFATEAEANEVLDLLEAAEPVDFDKDFLPLGWTFTN